MIPVALNHPLHMPKFLDVLFHTVNDKYSVGAEVPTTWHAWLELESTPVKVLAHEA
jgi:hypothetical protein